MRSCLAILAIGWALCGSAVVVAQPAPAALSVKIRVAYDGFSMTSAPLYYATQKGLFKQFGLDVAPVFVEGGSTLTHAVVGGSIDIAQNGYTLHPWLARQAEPGDGRWSSKVRGRRVVSSRRA